MAITPFPLSIQDAFSVKDKTVIVTGAAGVIGTGIAEVLAVNGAKVVCSDRPSEKLDNVVTALQAKGFLAHAIPADLTRPEELKSLVTSAVEYFGTLDGLINCGGIPNSGRIVDENPEDFDRIYHTNVRSLWLLSKYAAEIMDRETGGAIVNIASINGYRAFIPSALYVGSKAAVMSITRELAVELSPLNIRVNSVSPGMIFDPYDRFNQIRESLNEPYRSEIIRDFQPLENLDHTRNYQPVSLSGSKYDVAMACLYLLSPVARFITGADLIVDGGKMQEIPSHEARSQLKKNSPWLALRQKLSELPDSAWINRRPRWVKPAKT